MKNLTALRSIPVLLAAMLFVVTGCNPDNDDPVAPSGGGTPASSVPSGDHAQFTLDGQTITINASSTTVMSAFIATAQSDGIYQENQGTTVASVNGIPPQGISWARIKEIDVSAAPYGDPTDAEIDAMFQVQSYPYGKSINEVGSANSMDGVTVSYFGSDQVEWASDKGTGAQDGSTFSIVSRTPLTTSTWAGNYNVLVQFACKLYDGNGNVKTVTNGSMRGKAVLYY